MTISNCGSIQVLMGRSYNIKHSHLHRFLHILEATLVINKGKWAGLLFLTWFKF